MIRWERDNISSAVLEIADKYVVNHIGLIKHSTGDISNVAKQGYQLSRINEGFIFGSVLFIFLHLSIRPMQMAFYKLRGVIHEHFNRPLRGWVYFLISSFCIRPCSAMTV